MLAGFFRMNRAGRVGFLGVNTIGDPKRDPEAASNAAVDVSEARMIELVRAGVGEPDLPVQIDGFSRWRATADVAQRFCDGRVFIIGDAAHLMPPNGGFGGNTGIHDAHNLAWKLAHVIHGHAHPRLLDTYESERKPVAKFTVEQAFSRYVARTAPWLQATQTTEPIAHDFDIEIGYLYGREAVHADPRTTRGMPGSRLPHYWLERAGERVSTIDLTGRWLLLGGPRRRAVAAAAAPSAAAFGGCRSMRCRWAAGSPTRLAASRRTWDRRQRRRCWCGRTASSPGAARTMFRIPPRSCARRWPAPSDTRISQARSPRTSSASPRRAPSRPPRHRSTCPRG